MKLQKNKDPFEDDDEEYWRQEPIKQYKVQPVKTTKTDQQILRIYEKIMGEAPSEQPVSKIEEAKVEREAIRQSPKKIIETQTVLERIQQLPSRQAVLNDSSRMEEDQSPRTKMKKVKALVGQTQRIVENSNFKKKQPVRSDNQSRGRKTDSRPSRKVNNSAEYEESKPFQNKPTSVKQMLDQRKQTDRNIPNNNKSTQQKPTSTTAENFKKKLQQNLVKDRETQKPTMTPPISKSNRIIRKEKPILDERKIKEELLELNYEQTLLQAELRKIHLDNKQSCLRTYKQHNIRNTLSCAKDILGEDPLILNEQSPTKHPHSQYKQIYKKFKFLNEDKEYIDQINLELKKLDYLLKTKQQSVKQHQVNAQNDPLYVMIIASLNEEPEEAEPNESIATEIKEQQLRAEEDDTVYASYKEIMKHRKNKVWLRNQRINFNDGKTVKDSQVSEGIQGKEERSLSVEKIQTVEIEGVGKMKINANLKNLLLS